MQEQLVNLVLSKNLDSCGRSAHPGSKYWGFIMACCIFFLWDVLKL